MKSMIGIKMNKAGPEGASLPSQLFGKPEEKDPKIRACQKYSEFKAS